MYNAAKILEIYFKYAHFQVEKNKSVDIEKFFNFQIKII